MPTPYEAVIIGAGQAGGPLAGALADAGWRVALVERAHIGGTCVNEGCTPTKTMVASARVAHVVSRAADYGVLTSDLGLDLPAVRERKRRMVERFRSGSERRLEGRSGLDLCRGTGRLAASDRVIVEAANGERRELSASKIFLNTGLRPRIPELPGLSEVPFLDSTSIMELDRVPQHLLVLGGGYIGVEFGQMFRRFGSEVTIVQRAGQVLTHEDADIAGSVAEILREDGIQVMLDTQAVGVEEDGNDRIRLTVKAPPGERVLTGSHLLVAIGRVPNTEMLNLAAAGIEVNRRGFIPVDDQLETSVPGIYAMGDVKGGPAFTHIAYDDFRVARANLLDGERRSIAGRLIPYTVFMDPQLGGIGLTERQAEREGWDVGIATMPMGHVARALELDETRGMMKVLVDPKTERILGASVLGIEGGEILSILQTAMLGDLPFTALRDAPFAHPTLAESLNNLFATL
jgi:pyruvate/2-oxoglutarate dehydrogenase complex dihydrolipoamide dehydrogenase (E3) component